MNIVIKSGEPKPLGEPESIMSGQIWEVISKGSNLLVVVKSLKDETFLACPIVKESGFYPLFKIASESDYHVAVNLEFSFSYERLGFYYGDLMDPHDFHNLATSRSEEELNRKLKNLGIFPSLEESSTELLEKIIYNFSN